MRRSIATLFVLSSAAIGAAHAATPEATPSATQSAQAPAALAATATATVPAAASPQVGEVWRYAFVERFSGNRRDVSYRVDAVDSDKIVFNQGARIEYRDGRVDRKAPAIAGDYESMTPPSGWVPPNVKLGMRWKVVTESGGADRPDTLKARARAMATVTTPAGTFDTILIQYTGYARTLGAGGTVVEVPYLASLWYSPELGRAVRFDGAFRSSVIRNDESLVLVEHRTH